MRPVHIKIKSIFLAMGQGWFLPQAAFARQVFAHSQASTNAGHPAVRLFDHDPWIAEFLRDRVSPAAHDAVFQIARQAHPLCGMAFSFADDSAATEFLRTCSMAAAAPFADVVAVFCCESLGNTIQGDERPENITAVGNLAYIGMHHSSPEVRTLVKCMWNTYRASILS